MYKVTIALDFDLAVVPDQEDVYERLLELMEERTLIYERTWVYEQEGEES